MARTADVLSYLPSVLREVYEMQAVAQGENAALDGLWQGEEDLMNDQFIDSATENGVSRWESMLKIAPKATDTLTERKLNILVKLSGQHGYTLKVLEQHCSGGLSGLSAHGTDCVGLCIQLRCGKRTVRTYYPSQYGD